MSCIYRHQWSEIASLAHFKEAEARFPNIGSEDLLHRAEDIAKAELAKAMRADIQMRKDAEIMASVDWED